MMIVNKEKDIIYPMPEFEFQKTVVSQLARIEVRLGNIDTHLEKLNSKVATQEKENFQRQLELQQHVNKCPNIERIETLEQWHTSQDARASTDSKWHDRLKPIVIVLLTVIGTLILLNGPALLKALP